MLPPPVCVRVAPRNAMICFYYTCPAPLFLSARKKLSDSFQMKRNPAPQFLLSRSPALGPRAGTASSFPLRSPVFIPCRASTSKCQRYRIRRALIDGLLLFGLRRILPLSPFSLPLYSVPFRSLWPFYSSRFRSPCALLFTPLSHFHSASVSLARISAATSPQVCRAARRVIGSASFVYATSFRFPRPPCRCTPHHSVLSNRFIPHDSVRPAPFCLLLSPISIQHP